MRKLLISLAAAGAALAVASPASAQGQSYGYGQGYGHGDYGYHSGRRLLERVQAIRGQIRALQERRRLSWREARYLQDEANDLERHIYRDSGNGIQPGERERIDERLRRLEYRVQREASDFNNRPGGYGRY